ncbi:MAG: hypothetical protein ACYSTZ_04135, partial [Planctomycetota bacterium]
MNTKKYFTRSRIVLLTTVLLCCTFAVGQMIALDQEQSGDFGKKSGLAAPSSMPLQDYERDQLYPWLNARKYTGLGWAVDKQVRDTGPFVNQLYYGTHPAVRIYYSPEVMKWLTGGREGEIADGAVIVKEMFLPPAPIYQEIENHSFFREHPQKYEELLSMLLVGWSVLIKDRGGNSADGWFYAGPGAQGNQSTEDWLAANLDDYSHPFYSGFGLGTCVRCHASAEKENTFVTLRNIEGYETDKAPVQFHVDNSWRDSTYLATVYTTVQKFLKDAGDETAPELLAKLNLPPSQRPWHIYEDPELVKKIESDPELAKLKGTDPELAKFISKHLPPAVDPSGKEVDPSPLPPQLNKNFIKTYHVFKEPSGHSVTFPPIKSPKDVRNIPPQWSDHIHPGLGGPDSSINAADQFITANNCMGCHGGLGGSPYQVNMFIQTGPVSGEGYNISEYGEWRWSPMGLAGRDPIFHAQLESEMIILLKNANKLKYPGAQKDTVNTLVGSLEENQKALINTCLSCHGAMGQRQLSIDAAAGRKLPGGDKLAADFNPDYFYLTEALTQKELDNPPQPPTGEPNPEYSYANKDDYYNYHKYGELAREGISCAICHHITGPATTPEGAESMKNFLDRARNEQNWLPASKKKDLWGDKFFFFLAENTTGQFERNPADTLNGPFQDDGIRPVPMQHALGITPKYNKFTASSDMCGTCHTINLPNIGETHNEFPILTAIENNPAFKNYNHSIEQATYLEWLNSKFGPGEYNLRPPKDPEKPQPGENPDFQSCQDCHMPNRFTSLDGSIHIDTLVSMIASIQDATYPEAENAVTPEEMNVPFRDDYKRHELVGLNVFLVEMASQFADILGLQIRDYETGATTGPELAIESMVLSAKEGRVVTLQVGKPVMDKNNLTTEVTVTNMTGHRYPSGVAFRRAFIEFSVLDKKGKALWVSGATNSIGLILEEKDGSPLKTEFLDHVSSGNTLADYQPHYQVITRQDQVQIYEELTTNANKEFTTSFIHRVIHVKD